jgi:hypothetical protein
MIPTLLAKQLIILCFMTEAFCNPSGGALLSA